MLAYISYLVIMLFLPCVFHIRLSANLEWMSFHFKQNTVITNPCPELAALCDSICRELVLAYYATVPVRTVKKSRSCVTTFAMNGSARTWTHLQNSKHTISEFQRARFEKMGNKHCSCIKSSSPKSPRAPPVSKRGHRLIASNANHDDDEDFPSVSVLPHISEREALDGKIYVISFSIYTEETLGGVKNFNIWLNDIDIEMSPNIPDILDNIVYRLWCHEIRSHLHENLDNRGEQMT